MSAAHGLPETGRARLLQAYRATTYRVRAPGGNIDLRIDRHSGETSTALAVLLAGAGCWAIVTAWNPQSRAQDDATNAAAQAELGRRLAQLGYRCLPGENLADDGAWPTEPTYFVFGLAAEAARALGRDFGQQAVVTGRDGDAPQLCWCAGGADSAV